MTGVQTCALPIYQVGNVNGYNNTIYSLNYNIFGQASLTQDSEEILTDELTKSLSFDIKINNGWVNKTAKINVSVNLSASAWPTNTQNFFNFNYNLHEIKNNSNFNQDFVVNLDGDGFANLSNFLSIGIADLPVTGTITLTLLEINNQSSLVNPAANQIIKNVSL